MNELEARAARAADAWGLDLGPRMAGSRHSFVAAAGDRAVLKLRPLDDDESEHEAAALELWAGEGAVRLLRASADGRVLLLERALPGTDISALPEQRATAIAVAVGNRLWRPAAAPFRWIGDHVPRWLDQAERLGGGASELVPVARELHASLAVGRRTLVHGDLHHHNILAAGERHLAIDPKPMLGEPEFDVPSFLWNPLGSRLDPERTEARLAAFAAAGLDDRRMRAWTVIRGAYLASERELPLLRALAGSLSRD